MRRPRIRRRRDGVVQIRPPARWRLVAIALALALGALPVTLALVIVLPVLILEIPPVLVALAIALLLLFAERRHAARVLAQRRAHLRVVEALRDQG